MTTSRTFAIGDIHGCNTTFRLLLQQLALQPGDVLYCLGDYIDRGPDSKGVIDTILELREKGYTVHTLRGNHEQLLIEAVESPYAVPLWIRNGGDATLKSFGIKRVTDLPAPYLDFFHQTEDYLVAGNVILVHAGLNFSIDDPFEDHYAMLWTREPFVDGQWLGNRIVVHGHTPTPLERIRQQTGPVYNIDGGCVYNKKGYGNLVAINLQAKELIVQPSAEK
jgi:serine/threonine protein phosphatase 1